MFALPTAAVVFPPKVMSPPPVEPAVLESNLFRLAMSIEPLPSLPAQKVIGPPAVENGIAPVVVLVPAPVVIAPLLFTKIPEDDPVDTRPFDSVTSPARMSIGPAIVGSIEKVIAVAFVSLPQVKPVTPLKTVFVPTSA